MNNLRYENKGLAFRTKMIITLLKAKSQEETFLLCQTYAVLTSDSLKLNAEIKKITCYGMEC